MKKIFQYGIALIIGGCAAKSADIASFPCFDCEEILVEVDTSFCSSVSHEHDNFMLEIQQKETVLEEKIENVKNNHKKNKAIKKQNKKLTKKLSKAENEITLLTKEIHRLTTYIKEKEYNL